MKKRKSKNNTKSNSLLRGLAMNKRKVTMFMFALLFAGVGVFALIMSKASGDVVFQITKDIEAQTSAEFVAYPGIRAVQQSSEGRVTTVKDVAGISKAIRFKIKYPDDNGVAMSRPSGCKIGQGCAYAERTEIRLTDEATNAYPGNESWWRWKVYIPENIPTAPSDVKFNIFTQLHGGSGSPPFALGFVNKGGANTLRLELRGGGTNQNYRIFDIEKLKTGHWYTFVAHKKYSSSSNGALTELWVDKDVSTAPTVSDTRPNMYSSGGHYLKFGLYRGSHKPDQKETVVYHADWLIAKSKTTIEKVIVAENPAPVQDPGTSGGTDKPALLTIAQPNLLNGKAVTTKTTSTANYPAQNINDKNYDSRWISANNAGVEEISTDLGKNYALNKIAIIWASKTTKDFQIEVSQDNSTWMKIVEGTVPRYERSDSTTQHISDENFDVVSARYIRIKALNLHDVFNPANIGHSIYEIGIYGHNPAEVSFP